MLLLLLLLSTRGRGGVPAHVRTYCDFRSLVSSRNLITFASHLRSLSDIPSPAMSLLPFQWGHSIFPWLPTVPAAPALELPVMTALTLLRGGRTNPVLL